MQVFAKFTTGFGLYIESTESVFHDEDDDTADIRQTLILSFPFFQIVFIF